MELKKNDCKLELAPKKSGKVQFINKTRLLVGRSRCCDIVLNHPDVSAIHAVIESKKNGVIVYDMNSSNGTFVDGERIVRVEIEVGQSVSFGKNEYDLKAFSQEDVPALPLKMLEEALPPQIIAPSTRQLPNKGLLQDSSVDEISYPLAKDPQADYSEYIFEDVDQLYPIFKYEVSKKSIEVIILFRDEIFSVDYLPLKNKVYKLKGKNPRKGEIELSTLSCKESVDFVTIEAGDVYLEKPVGYSSFSVKEKGPLKASGAIALGEEDIVCFRKGALQIFVRGSEAPPLVKFPPVMKMERDFRKYLVLMLCLVISFLIAMTMFKVDKELEKEKIPERIATILYKKKFEIKKIPPKEKPTKIAIKKIEKPVMPSKEKVLQVKKKPPVIEKMTKVKVVKTGEKIKTSTQPIRRADPAKKAPPKKIIVKKVIQPRKVQGKKQSTRKIIVPKKNIGSVDTYVSTDFTNTLSSFLSKGAKIKNAKVANQAGGSSGELLLDTSVASAGLTQTKVKHDIGSLTGAVSGKLDSAKGLEGVESRKKAVYMDVPVATVTLSSMNPGIIRSILMDYLPQFKYCYQKGLESSTKSFDGMIVLDFIIGASGHVVDAGLSNENSNLPSKVKSCVVNVLLGIKFPEPMGGGKVEVNQPMNFRINN